MIVLEDDVRIDQNFDFDSLASLITELRIEYLKLYSRYITRFRYIGRVGHRGLYRFSVPSYGAQAYMVSRRAARRFVEDIRRIDRPIDDELERYWNHGLPLYALFPYPVIELSVGSTVPKGFDKRPPLTLSQRVSRLSRLCYEKVPRELENWRLRSRDHVLKDKLRETVRPA